MKKLFLASMVCLALIACSKDDDGGNNGGGASSESKFTYDGETYKLKGGVLDYYGEDVSNSGVYNFDVTLTTTTVNNAGIPADDIFDVIYFEIFTDNPNNLKVGTYTQGEEFETIAGTIGYADIGIGISYDEEEGIYYTITSSTFKVIANGTYEFEFSGTADGKPFSGNYKGSLLKLDFEE